VHRQVVDNTEEKNYTQTYIERMGAQNEDKKNFKEKKTSDHRSKIKKKKE
jgi:hypothetical protein